MPKMIRLPFSSLGDPDAKNPYIVNADHVVLIQADGKRCNIWLAFSSSPWRCQMPADAVVAMIEGEVHA